MSILEAGWTWDPFVLAGTGLAAYFYLRFWLWLRPRPFQAVLFFAGLAVVLLALVSPLHRAGDRLLFSLHVAQHGLLQMVAPILLVLGLPRSLFERLHAHPKGRAALRWVFWPILAFVGYNAVLGLWHLPMAAGGLRVACGVPTDLPLQSPLLLSLQDGLPLLVGLLFWGAVLVPQPYCSHPRAIRMGLLGGAWLLNWLISFVNAAPDRVLYGTYATAHRVLGLSAIDDQMLGAGILWEHGNMTYIAALIGQLWGLMRERKALDDAPLGPGVSVDPDPPAGKPASAGHSP